MSKSFVIYFFCAKMPPVSGLRKQSLPLLTQAIRALGHQINMRSDCPLKLPTAMVLTCRRLGIRPSRHLLVVSIQSQEMTWLEQTRLSCALSCSFPVRLFYRLRRKLLISTSRFGPGQKAHSNQTPLGLHRIACKIGSGRPIGTVFEGRRPVGFTWQGRPDAAIAHRILWLEGLEPGFNRGGQVDSFRRYIYIHGLGNEPTLGRPASRGCVHLAASDLLPLFDNLPVGTLVWIAER